MIAVIHLTVLLVVLFLLAVTYRNKWTGDLANKWRGRGLTESARATAVALWLVTPILFPLYLIARSRRTFVLRLGEYLGAADVAEPRTAPVGDGGTESGSPAGDPDSGPSV